MLHIRARRVPRAARNEHHASGGRNPCFARVTCPHVPPPFLYARTPFPGQPQAVARQGAPPGQLGERGHAEAQHVHSVPDQTAGMYVIVQWGGVLVLRLMMPPTSMPVVSPFCLCFWGRATHFFTARWQPAWVNRKKVGSKDS